MESGWRWRRGSVQAKEGTGDEALWLARGPPKGLAACNIIFLLDIFK